VFQDKEEKRREILKYNQSTDPTAFVDEFTKRCQIVLPLNEELQKKHIVWLALPEATDRWGTSREPVALEASPI
jgi:hypothetical protein